MSKPPNRPRAPLPLTRIKQEFEHSDSDDDLTSPLLHSRRSLEDLRRRIPPAPPRPARVSVPDFDAPLVPLPNIVPAARLVPLPSTVPVALPATLTNAVLADVTALATASNGPGSAHIRPQAAPENDTAEAPQNRAAPVAPAQTNPSTAPPRPPRRVIPAPPPGGNQAPHLNVNVHQTFVHGIIAAVAESASIDIFTERAVVRNLGPGSEEELHGLAVRIRPHKRKRDDDDHEEERPRRLWAGPGREASG